MSSGNTMRPSANLQVKADGREKQLQRGDCVRNNCGKTNLFCSCYLAHGGCGWPRGSHVASGDLGGLRVASRDHMWPQGVAGGLRGSGVALGLRMAIWVWSRGLGVSSWGYGWPWGVAGCLWGLQLTSQVTLITCQVFKNAPNFRIKLLTQRSVFLQIFGWFRANFGPILLTILIRFWGQFWGQFWDQFLANFALILRPVFQGATGAVRSHEGLKQHKVKKATKLPSFVWG
jgi:hypothetical protein